MGTPLIDQLANYAAYHRDRRNLATHVVGVPMIVVAVTVLLARPAGPLGLSPAVLAALSATAFYVRLDRRYAAVMAAFLAASVAFAAWTATLTTGLWLSTGIGLFVVGWFIQFVGHAYESRKPAFMDDVVGFLIGPLFMLAEVGFALGLRDEVRIAIEERVGPTRVGPAAVRA